MLGCEYSWIAVASWSYQFWWFITAQRLTLLDSFLRLLFSSSLLPFYVKLEQLKRQQMTEMKDGQEYLRKVWCFSQKI